MSPTQDDTLISTYDLNDARTNQVRRRLAREALPYAFATLAFFFTVTASLVYIAARDWISALADGTDDIGAVINTGLAGLIAWFAWRQAKATGAMIAHAKRPDSTICKGLVDGVSIGACTSCLSDDAVSWDMREHFYALHLGCLHRVRTHADILFLRNNFAEVRFLFADTPDLWAETLKRRQKALGASGWALPEGSDWHRYVLPRTGFEAALTKTEVEGAPSGSLWLNALNAGILGVVLFFLVRDLAAGILTTADIQSVVISLFCVTLLAFELPILFRAIRRKRYGMSPFGRDVLDMTYGDSAYQITDAGIEIRRAYQHKVLRWPSITRVEQVDDWLALRTAETTLDILPPTADVLKALGDQGFNVPSGPWERAKGSKAWDRAA